MTAVVFSVTYELKPVSWSEPCCAFIRVALPVVPATGCLVPEFVSRKTYIGKLLTPDWGVLEPSSGTRWTELVALADTWSTLEAVVQDRIDFVVATLAAVRQAHFAIPQAFKRTVIL